MKRTNSIWRYLRSSLILLAAFGPSIRLAADESEDRFEVITVRGRVVWMAEALARLHGVKTVPESAERILALETESGELHPIVEDIRGRAFRRDPRLRDMDVALLVRRHRGSSMLQVIRAFELTKEGIFELDYWCEICSIAMFELKACDCCQGPIDLRKRRAKSTD